MKQLPVVGGPRTGGPVAWRIVAASFTVSLTAWVAAAAALIAGASDLARGDPGASAPVLAAHLAGLGFLPFAVTAAALHLLPVMLRNDLRRQRLIAPALTAVGGGFLLAPGIAFDENGLFWTGLALISAGLAGILTELLGLVTGAPRGRVVVASRAGLSLVTLHVTAALVLGIVLFASEEGESPLGVPHDRWLLVHLHLAVLGWLTLLILTVGRTLAPMLALAPAAPTRRVPLSELGLTGGLWLLLAGLAADIAPLAAAGATVIALVLAIFGHLLVRIAGTRRMELEAPLAHMLAGIAFLLQATLLGFLLLGGVNVARGTVAYVILLLVGWAAGVTVGYSGKLLSLSAWVWWPPGPRPKQAALYPRRWWQLEVVAFAIGVEVVAVGVLLGSAPTTRAGAAVLCFSAVLALCGVVREIRVRSWLLAQSAR